MSTTTKHIGITLILVLSSGAALFFLLNHINQQSNELQAALQAINNKAAVDQAFIRLSDVLANTEADRVALRSYIINGEQGTISFLTELETLAASYGVTLQGTALETATQDQFALDLLRISAGFTGPQANTITFLELLETLPYASYVDTVTYAIEYENGVPVTITGQFTLYVAIKNIDT